ncbi:MAG: reverse transcriptase domain-containing protein [Thermodesulfobacteriota bacterium]
MQVLCKLALAPVAEMTADRNSYGFQEGRSCADAAAAAFNALSKPNSATWIPEGDIKGCFRQHIPRVDDSEHPHGQNHSQQVVEGWICRGWYQVSLKNGDASGGIISPTLFADQFLEAGKIRIVKE